MAQPMTQPMAQQFADQGGAASSNPSALKRWLGSLLMRRMTGLKARSRRRQRLEKARKAQGRPHQVEYFHQIDDAYSHLTAQLLQPLLASYDIELIARLVTGPTDKNAPEPELLLDYARYDSSKIAPQYQIDFPVSAEQPGADLINQAARILAAAGGNDFIQQASVVGEALWAGDVAALTAMEAESGSVNDEQAQERIAEGSARRHALGHYSGAMFYYEAEWYWGVDRLHHLENRLRELGACRQPESALLAPRPSVAQGPLKDSGQLTLEFYPSLRSPYTSIIYDQTLTMARDMGVNLVTRPVMPMVMRGVPLTRNKGIYITSDVAREAEAMGLEWGRIYDPIGDPVRKAFSLYPYAVEQGLGAELLRYFLQAAWVKGVNTNSTKGMRWVVEQAGLNWDEAQPHFWEPGWEEMLEDNRLAMYEFGLWGVPSYRILDESGEVRLGVWGQDRLWLVAQTIQSLLQGRQST